MNKYKQVIKYIHQTLEIYFVFITQHKCYFQTNEIGLYSNERYFSYRIEIL